MIRRKSTGPRKPKKVVANPRVPRTRNNGTETEAQHLGKIRSALRHISRFWKPITEARKRNKVGVGKSAKYYCDACKGLFPSIEVDHIIPAGSLRNYDDLPDFCRRLFEERPEAFQCLCPLCHKEKTHQ
jgi:hypothetical protein